MPNEDIVTSVLGQWGPWQRRAVFLVYLCKIPSAWFMACIIFTAPTPRAGEFFCQAPDAMVINGSSAGSGGPAVASLMAARQMMASTAAQLPDQLLHDETVHVDHHVVLPAMFETCHTSNGINGSEERIPCKAFQHAGGFTSLVTQFDLVCSNTILIAVTQFFHLFGVLTGGILATKLLEIMSPRHVMLLGMVAQIFCGCITGLTNSFIVHIFFRCLSAVSCAQMYTAGQMIFTDLTGGKARTTAVCLFESFWSLGVIVLPLLAYIMPDWSNLYLMISLPTCLYVMLWMLIPESPRWLLMHGEPELAKAELLRGAAYNGRQVDESPAALDERLRAYVINGKKEQEQDGRNWWSLWRGRHSVIAIVAAHIAWAVYVTNYNGMLLNVKAYGRDFLSLNTVIMGLCEIVGVLIALTLVLKAERKWLWAGLANVVAGLITYIGFAVPEMKLSANESTAVLMMTAGISKMAVSIAQSMLFSCTGELVAPEKRPILMFSCVVWARIWLLCAPFIGALAGFHQSLGLAAFGTLSVIGGVATAVLPKLKAF